MQTWSQIHVSDNMQKWNQINASDNVVSTWRHGDTPCWYPHGDTSCQYPHGDTETLHVHIHIQTWRHSMSILLELARFLHFTAQF